MNDQFSTLDISLFLSRTCRGDMAIAARFLCPRRVHFDGSPRDTLITIIPAKLCSQGSTDPETGAIHTVAVRWLVPKASGTSVIDCHFATY